jgi:3-methylfumaryl-CoA hydratase
MTDPQSLPKAASWIGRTFERSDVIDQRLVAEFTATLSPYMEAGSTLPPGIHWCLAPDILASGELGRDGHPKLGTFLPDLGFERRMWAGGELVYHGAFMLGDTVAKTSTIEDVAVKSGKSGKLVFVTVRQLYHARGSLILEERQDIVYRQAPPTSRDGAPASTIAPSVDAATQLPSGSWSITPSSVLLFRYSAMTFNSHRIHYDEAYARQIEGYDGLVVHGPLQATFMLNLAAARSDSRLRRFSYRGIAPLICDGPFQVTAIPRDGALETKVVSRAGTVTMSGTAV